MDSPFCFCCRLILIQVDFSCKVVGINRNNGATSIGAASSDTVVKLDKLLREIRENVTSCVNIFTGPHHIFSARRVTVGVMWVLR